MVFCKRRFANFRIEKAVLRRADIRINIIIIAYDAAGKISDVAERLLHFFAMFFHKGVQLLYLFRTASRFIDGRGCYAEIFQVNGSQ